MVDIVNSGADPSPLGDNRGRVQQRPFRIYNGYRILVGLVLIGIFANPDTRDLVGNYGTNTYLAGCGFMVITGVILLTRLGQALCQSETGVFALMFSDVVSLSLISNTSGGLASGFSVLYMVTVAAAAVLISTRILSTLIAALAVLAVLSGTLWFINQSDSDYSLMLPAGVLGSLLFAISLLVQSLARRLESAETTRDAAESRAAALQRLNQQIILHMQTGILLVSANRRVTPVNAAAQRLLQLGGRQRVALADISPVLAEQFDEWQEGSLQQTEPFVIKHGNPPVIANFSSIEQDSGKASLIFIDDYTPVTQFAQSLKINSLGKLTASIAHEIRNPLSSISHAIQLLNESDNLNESDQGLCDIALKNGRRVDEIIESVLEISRRKPPRRQVLDLDDCLPELISTYLSQPDSHDKIAVDIMTKQIRIAFDVENLNRVLFNLLDNALRHSEQARGERLARIDVSVDDDLSLCYIDVVDAGNGVREADVAQLFEPFFTTSAQGSGLGLYLCRDLCEINRASLEYRPTNDGESAFRLTAKLEPAPL